MSATSQVLLETIQSLEKQISLIKASNGDVSELETQLIELKKKHASALNTLNEGKQLLRG